MFDPTYIMKMYKTRMIETCPKIKRAAKYVAVLHELDSVNDILGMPYDIILVGETVISQVLIYKNDYPEIAGQIIGAYCKSEHEKRIAEYVSPNIRIGLQDTFESIDDFIKSINPELTIWTNETGRPKLHLFVQVWKHSDPARLEELQVALLKNAENPLVHHIHVSLDGENAHEVLTKIPLELYNKIVIVPIMARLTFKDALNYMSSLPADDFVALINTDIYFDNTIRELWNVSMKNTCFALLRYESSVAFALRQEGAVKPQIYGPRSDSQDAWIFAVSELLEHKESESWDDFDFCLGMPGCDNTFAGELLRRKWNSVNPALSIYALHLHQTQIREYNRSNLVTKFLFHLIAPSAIIP
jgi:hypothetical protein